MVQSAGWPEMASCHHKARASWEERRCLLTSPAQPWMGEKEDSTLPCSLLFCCSLSRADVNQPGLLPSAFAKAPGLGSCPRTQTIGGWLPAHHFMLTWHESFSAAWLLEAARGCLALVLPADRGAGEGQTLSPLFLWASACLSVAVICSYFSIKLILQRKRSCFPQTLIKEGLRDGPALCRLLAAEGFSVQILGVHLGWSNRTFPC